MDCVWCSDCFDPDHPQLRVGELQTSDPQSLFNARQIQEKKNLQDCLHLTL